MNKPIQFLVLLITFYGCSSSRHNVDVLEYFHWCEKNLDRLSAEKTVNTITYNFQFLPNELLAIRRFYKESMNSIPVDSVLSKVSKEPNQYFVLKIGPSTGDKHILYHKLNHISEYNQRVYYYSFDVKNDLLLVEGNDTLRCIDSNFERTYGATPYITLNLIFPKHTSKSCNDIELIYNDVIFSNGRVKLAINKEHISQIPLLSNIK